MIRSIVRPDKVDDVLDALLKVRASGLTVREVLGHGRQKGRPLLFRGRPDVVSLRSKVEIDVVVPNAAVKETEEAIIQAARTGDIGDGRLFVFPVDRSYRISTGRLEGD